MSVDPEVKMVYRARRIHRIRKRGSPDHLEPPPDTPELRDLPLVLVNGDWVDGFDYFAGRGGGGTGGRYLHTQAVASREWVIDHNLNDVTPRVVAFDKQMRRIVGLQSMTASTADRLVLYFYLPVAGTAAIYGG